MVRSGSTEPNFHLCLFPHRRASPHSLGDECHDCWHRGLDRIDVASLKPFVRGVSIRVLFGWLGRKSNKTGSPVAAPPATAAPVGSRSTPQESAG